MRALTQIWYHQQFRNFLFQISFLVLISWCAYNIWLVLHNNLDERGIEIGFSFLKDTAGFNIIQHLIFYNEQSNYLRVFTVGLLNTLVVSFIGIIFATVLGFLIGIARVSLGPQRVLATLFVETIRNVPLLLQLFIWYFVVLRSAPYPQHHYSLFGNIFITNRGIYLPSPLGTPPSSYYLLAGVSCFLLLLLFLYCQQHARLHNLSKQTIFFKLRIAFILLTLLFCGLFIGSLNWEVPVLGRFNFEHGLNLLPEFLALLFALSIYTAAYIAEIVRMGLLSVPKGQWEASKSLGFSRWQSLRLIIIPQSLKVILPPLTNQYLNLIKNSSLATAIAYPDLVSIFAGTALNQTGQAIEIIAMTMAVYLFISLVISFLMLSYERATAWGKSK